MSQIFYEVLMEKRANANQPVPISHLEAQIRDAKRTFDSYKAGRGRLDSLIHPITGGAVGAVGGGLYGMNVGPQQAGETDEQYASRRRMGAAKGAIGGTLIGTAFGTHVTPEIERFNIRRLDAKDDRQLADLRRVAQPHIDIANAAQRANPNATTEYGTLHDKLMAESPDFARYLFAE